eukprot:jgi/Ulvmu1/11122/UM071_0005.1
MADVEESKVATGPSVQELRASEVPDREPTHRPGGITRHSRSESADRRNNPDGRYQAESPSRKAGWKTFCKEYPQKRSDVAISDYSKEEGVRRKKWEKERRALRERQARLQQDRAEAEAAKQKELQEKQMLEHKARVQARISKQQDKIRRAAEERQRREQAYQELLSKTRERGLLFERLQEAGESKVHAIENEKKTDYVNTLGRLRKLGAQEIATRTELHPSLRVVQRRKQEEILQREADKAPTAFTPKAADSPVAGSPVSSFMTTRRMPGASLSGGLATGAAATGRSAPAKPARKRRPPRKAKPAPAVTERASSPLAVPGVEIHVNGVLYEVPSPQAASCGIGIPARTSSTAQASSLRDGPAVAEPDTLAKFPSAASNSSRRHSGTDSAADVAVVEPAGASSADDALPRASQSIEQHATGLHEDPDAAGSAEAISPVSATEQAAQDPLEDRLAPSGGSDSGGGVDEEASAAGDVATSEADGAGGAEDGDAAENDNKEEDRMDDTDVQAGQDA